MKEILVFAGWEKGDKIIGTLHINEIRGREIFAFSYDENWVDKGVSIAPELPLMSGWQYLSNDKLNFGVFSDTSPDRWGRLLMQRAEAYENPEKKKTLLESDYMLRVSDYARMGGLRFKDSSESEYLAPIDKNSIPPITSLRELQDISLSYEKDRDKNMDKWISQLAHPGSSLGGARPKASVINTDGSLWIAKFPSKNDVFNIGAWEKVANNLAKKCNINTVNSQLFEFSKGNHTFLSKRFDRDNESRIHFMSAMTALGLSDGETELASYVDMASFIRQEGGNVIQNLSELWRRLILNISISNTDDHLRNHGFLLVDNKWELSPIYDINPNIEKDFLSLPIINGETELSYDLAIDTAKYYGLNKDSANEIVRNIKEIVSKTWEQEANKCGIKKSEIKEMSEAFKHANEIDKMSVLKTD